MAQCWLRYKKYSPQMGVDHVPQQDFYNGFGVDSMYMTTEAWRFSFARGTRDSLTTCRSLPPPPYPVPSPYTLTTLIITPQTG